MLWDKVSSLNLYFAKRISCLTLAIAGLTFFIVVFRYVFSLGWIWMQDLVIYGHALVFLGGVGYAFQEEAHVRVDVLYQNFSSKKKAWVNLIGHLLFVIPTVIVVFIFSWNYVIDSWSLFEGAKDAGGLEAIFILKTFIWVFVSSLFLQSVCIIRNSWQKIKGRA